MLRSKYGIDQGEYDKMLRRQGGACAICGKKPDPLAKRMFHVDHCHNTGAVRGILCAGCNTSIGKLGDTVESVQRAVDYLRGEG